MRAFGIFLVIINSICIVFNLMIILLGTATLINGVALVFGIVAVLSCWTLLMDS